MKKILILLLPLFFLNCNKTNKTDSNILTKPSIEVNIKSKGCGYTSLIEIENNFIPAEYRVNEIIENIVSYSGLPNNFKVYRADYINNAYATIIENERVIVYDSKLFNNVEWYSDTFWTSVSILAHEVGHHLSGHTEDDLGSVPLKELEADLFSGYVLYKLGATVEQATSAIRLLSTEYDTETHPSKHKRIEAIEKGWNQSNNQRYKSALPPAPKGKPSDFYIFTKEMIVDKEHLYNETYPNWFEFEEALYGIVTEVYLEKEQFQVRILKSSDKDLAIINKDWNIYIESSGFGANTEMCHACAFNLKELLTPGRRIKFGMVESLPDHGTSLNGAWFLTYLEALPENYFDNL